MRHPKPGVGEQRLCICSLTKLQRERRKKTTCSVRYTHVSALGTFLLRMRSPPRQRLEDAMITIPRLFPLLRFSFSCWKGLYLTFWSIAFCLSFPTAQSVFAAPPSLADTVRFLEQSTFGPTPELIGHVQAVGFEAFLDEQFTQPLPSYPDLGLWSRRPPEDCQGECRLRNYTMYPLQVRFFARALLAPDQLRQRMTFALNQIFVISAEDNDLRLPSRMQPYLQVLESVLKKGLVSLRDEYTAASLSNGPDHDRMDTIEELLSPGLS
ncbi:MAG: DUF1800 domain-containing protein, partial [Deltaproteobacteria bacterium]|nr:DUF1800 domain-containing protein [Deltaproteobacteria bacterium]